jgi:mevalonate pyrophosphate decarboxylase
MKIFIAVLVLCVNSECVLVSADDTYYTQQDCERKVRQVSETASKSGFTTFAAACLERNLNNHTRN